MLSNVVSSSLDLHAAYGGVVPEIAARSHVEVIIPVIKEALAAAQTDWDDIDAIAVTNRPGLIGSLLIGVLTARTLAITKKKPVFGINHVLAHTYANLITQTSLPGYQLNAKPPQFPALGLIVSGGHTQLMLYRSHTDYTLLGQTKDDAVGEAYDKVAKILGLPYPGGPAVDKAAKVGSASVKLPIARMKSYDFSFSGLKTAVLRAAQQMAASFQKTAIDTLAIALSAAEQEFKPKTVLIAGGVAANLALRETLKVRLYAPLLYPDIKLCTDNAAMIASAAYYWQQPADNPYKLTVIPSL
jgi:N6-L-threonylcarbamoyladenine synthase